MDAEKRILQDLDNRRYRVVYANSKNNGELIEVIGEAAACEICTAGQLLHISLGMLNADGTAAGAVFILIQVDDVRQVWESSQPIQAPHDYTGEIRVF